MTMGNIAYPYKTIRDEGVNSTEWMVEIPGYDAVSGSEQIDGWDYDRSFRLLRKFRINIDQCLDDIGLESRDNLLSLNIVLETGPTGYKWVGKRCTLKPTGIQDIEIAIDIDSEKLCSRLEIYSDITLFRDLTVNDYLTAKFAGTRLWNDNHTITLEGKKSSFPLDTIDFSKNFPGQRMSNACWYLYWDASKPEYSFSGNVVLYLNSNKNNLINEMLEKNPFLLSWLRCDVIRQMCMGMLDSEEFIENASTYEKGTVGHTVYSWLTIAFEDKSLDSIRLLYIENRAGFEVRIQSTFGE